MASRLLVIDDSLTIRKLVEMSFRAHDFALDFATTGRDGVLRATSTRPDLILLDYVLPDMKGADVCRELAANDKSSQLPIIIMSAKSQDAPELPLNHAQVIGFMSKPFTIEEVFSKVTGAIGDLKNAAQGTPVDARPVEIFTREQKEAAARVLFKSLRPRLAEIPSLMAGLGTTAADVYFARKLLTPALLGELLDGLQPFYREALVAQAPAPTSDAILEGRLAALSVPSALEALAARKQTGELVVTVESTSTRIYLKQGDVVLITTSDPVEYAKGASYEWPRVPAPARQRAEEEQRLSGKPVFVSLAEAGHGATSELASLLAVQGRRALAAVVDARGEGDRLAFQAHAILPLYVDAHGRARSLAQLGLRRASAASTPEPTPDAIFERAPSFSTRIAQVELSAQERRALGLVDGKTSVQQMIARSGIPSKDLLPYLAGLAEAQLVRVRSAPAARARAVLVCEPDEGFTRPLASLLSARTEPLVLVEVAAEEPVTAWVEVATREQPCLIVINVGALTSYAAATKLARAISSVATLGAVPLVAILDRRITEAQRTELLANGFASVLVKPVQVVDLERMLVNQ